MNYPAKSILQKIVKSHFVKNITIVMTGTVLAQALGFVISPIISRLFSPADFGVFGSFNSVLGIVTAGITLEYSAALILPKKKNDALNLLVFSCICTTVISFCSMIVFFTFPAYFKSILKAPSPWVLLLLILGIFINGLNQTFQAWCVREKSFKHTSASQVIRSLSANGMQIGIGFLKGSSLGLIWSSVLADGLATINLARVAVRDFKGLYKDISLRQMKRLVIEYRDFPTYSASMAIINAASMGLPILLLTHYYGLAVAGAYAFGLRIISLPMSFVERALKQVLYQKSCRNPQ